ncbi:hypothetical protein R1flu_013383 [Riccia fluitans]|uniref:Uncharacterized protein n=1 Tax=Riccia fluitans TaxID=41844 RepID=A0ABD1YD84_9MARC
MGPLVLCPIEEIEGRAAEIRREHLAQTEGGSAPSFQYAQRLGDAIAGTPSVRSALSNRRPPCADLVVDFPGPSGMVTRSRLESQPAWSRISPHLPRRLPEDSR